MSNCKSTTKNADENIVYKLIRYSQKSLQGLNIILHKYDWILKSRYKKQIFQILKNCQIYGSKKLPKNALNYILCTKHVLYTYTVPYISLKVHKYC